MKLVEIQASHLKGETMNKQPVIIAVVGKGGVGKTSLSAVIVKALCDAHKDKKILAIDADPAVGLATALNIDVETTVDDLRREFVNLTENGDLDSAITMLGEAKYRIFDALVEKENYSFLAIGRPESSGCYCKVNAYLKEVISILSENFDYVVIDGEAGIEQINRRVMEKVTHLLLVSDASKKGLQVIKTIEEVSNRLVMADKCGAIINRAPYDGIESKLDLQGIPLLACISQDNDLCECDIDGRSVFDLEESSKIVQGAKKALSALEII